MRAALVTGAIVALAVASVIRPSPAIPSSPDARPLLYTVAQKYAPLAWISGEERFPFGASVFIDTAEGRRVLVKGFAASADPSVSLDGSRVLLAGKQRVQDHWQIWEVSSDGSNSRHLTSCADDCVRPLYLPEDRFVYAHKVHGRFIIEAAPLKGGSPLPLTYAPGNYFPTDILRDGRVLFEATYPFGNGTAPELYTVYSDGSGVESYRCDHGPARHSGRQIASADIVFARTLGLGRFTSALASQVEIPVPGGEYAGDIAETSSGEWLIARRTSPNRHFELVRWSPGGSGAAPLVEEKNADIVEPVLLAARPVPNRHPSALHDWTYANLLCLNAYTSKYRFADGTIAAVRLYTQDSSGAARLLGSTAVEKDGSFYLRTPADQPLKIELLDASGQTLKKEAGWFWLRRGEQRICVGCHAGPETAPENAVPMVLQRSIVAADMTGGAAQTTRGDH